jgi:drug/metabolite transporter (DMT)-like permease
MIAPALFSTGRIRHRAVPPALLPVLAGSGPILALTFASILWGTADVAGKLAMSAIPPVTLAALRFAIALAVLWTLSRRRGGPRVPARVAAPLGLIGVALTFFLQNLGLDRTAAANASMLQAAVPVMTVVLAVAFLGEPLGGRRLLSVGAAAAGVAAVTLSGGTSLSAPGLGDLLVLASTACFAAFVVLGRRAFPVYGALPVLTAMTAWGTAALIPAAAVELSLNRPAGIGPGEVALVLYLGAGCSALTYGLWGYALCHLEAARAAIFDALIPIIGILTAVVVLREAPAMWQLAGGALVVTAVWLAVREPQAVLAASVLGPTGPCSRGRMRNRRYRNGKGRHMRVLTIVLVGLLVSAVAALAAPAGPAGAADPPTCTHGYDQAKTPATKWLTSPGVLIGTSGDDVLVGSSGNDIIKGNGGNDLICGGGGNDKINGNSGDDEVYGEAGDDTVAGDAGNDWVEGDFFAFACRTGYGDDVVTGGTGNDEVYDACGNNVADGGAGQDFVFASGTARGGADTDQVGATDGRFGDCQRCVVALADGGSGNDRAVDVEGGVATGGSGDDLVRAQDLGDKAYGGSGNDRLVASFDGAATVDGGSGKDECVATGDDTVISCEKVSSN